MEAQAPKSSLKPVSLEPSEASTLARGASHLAFPMRKSKKRRRRGLNSGPFAREANALTIELCGFLASDLGLARSDNIGQRIGKWTLKAERDAAEV